MKLSITIFIVQIVCVLHCMAVPVAQSGGLGSALTAPWIYGLNSLARNVEGVLNSLGSYANNLALPSFGLPTRNNNPVITNLNPSDANNRLAQILGSGTNAIPALGNNNNPLSALNLFLPPVLNRWPNPAATN